MNVFRRDSLQNLFVVMGALYSSVMFLGVNNSSSVQPVVAIERTVFYRERAAGMYAAWPYAVAQVDIFWTGLNLLISILHRSQKKWNLSFPMLHYSAM